MFDTPKGLLLYTMRGPKDDRLDFARNWILVTVLIRGNVGCDVVGILPDLGVLTFATTLGPFSANISWHTNEPKLP